jgi:hypothetical protein
MTTQTKLRDYQQGESVYRYELEKLCWKLQQPSAAEFDLLDDFAHEWLLFVCQDQTDVGPCENTHWVAGLTKKQLETMLGLLEWDRHVQEYAVQVLEAALADREEER